MPPHLTQKIWLVPDFSWRFPLASSHFTFGCESLPQDERESSDKIAIFAVRALKSQYLPHETSAMKIHLLRSLGLSLGMGLLSLVFAAPVAANQVAARLEGSLLVITGDNLGNQIVVSQNAANDVTIRGVNGTRVNGLPSVVFRRAALQQAEILMEGGNDIVTFSNFAVSNDLFINLGAGNDAVRTGAAPSSIGVGLSIEGGTGTDTISLSGWQTGGDLFIDGQGGILRTTLTNTTILGAFAAIGGEANDQVTMTGCTVGLDASLQLGKGADVVSVTDLMAFSFWAATDEGADRVTVAQTAVLEDFGIFTGTENDVVNLSDVDSGKNVYVGTDLGADQVVATRVAAELDAVFEGGAGVDSLADRGIFGGVKVEIKEFEIFP